MANEYPGQPAGNGFGFNPGELIPLAPDVFPGESYLIQLSEMGMQYGGWITVVSAIVFAILEIVNFLFQLFAGKPRAQDTITVAHRLAHSINPAGHLASVLILRGLNERDIVLSASDPPDSDYVNAVRHQLVLSLEAQGASVQQAKHVAMEVWGNTTSGNQALPAELTVPLNQKYTLIGPPIIQADYAEHYNLRIQRGDTPDVAAQKATKFVYNQERLHDLLQIQTKPQPAGTPPPPARPCPPGQRWDWQTQSCVPDVIVPKPPPGGDGGGQGDELTDCCEQTAYYLGLISASLVTLAGNFPQPPGGTPPPADDCCPKIVAAIAEVTVQLSKIALAVASGAPGAPPTVDLTPVVDGLGRLAVEVAASGSGATAQLKCICDGLAAINNTLAKGAGAVDFSQIVEQLKRANEMADVPQRVLDELTRQGSLSPELAQLIQGSPWAEVFAGLLGELGKFLGGELGDVEHGLGKLLVNVIEPGGSKLWSLLITLRNAFVAAFEREAPGAVTAFVDAIQTLARDLEVAGGAPAIVALSFVLEPARAMGHVTPGEQEDAAQKTFSRAWLLGMLAHLLAMLSGIVPTPLAFAFEGFASQVSKAAGWDEIVGAVHEPWYSNAFRIPANYEARKLLSPNLPSYMDAQIMLSRRAISDVEHNELLGFAGMTPAWRDRLAQTAFRAMSPMMLAAGFLDEDIDQVQLRHVFEFMGLRDQDIDIGLRAVENRSLQRVRDAYVNEAMSGYAKGVVGDAELDQVFDEVSWGTAARSLAHKRALIMRRVTIAAEREAEAAALVAAGLLAPDAAILQLEAAGIQDWQAERKVAIAEERAEITANRRAVNEAEREARAARANLKRAAVAEYETGVIDETGLAAALALIPLPLSEIVSIVAVESAKRVGRLKYVFGQLLTPEDAAILKDQVATLESNVKHGITPADSAIAQLEALKVPTAEAKALVARWLAAPKPPQ